MKPAGDTDPDGPNRARISAQVQPLIDAELATTVVVGVIDAGKKEIYGFGKGPDGKPPTGATLFELGSLTRAYTGLLLADSVQRREVELDTPVAELLPTGVTAPTKDKLYITLRHLALHSSGLPPIPPSLKVESDNPFGTYRENQLYQDLVRTQLVAAPGERIVYSDYGFGLLGNALGRKIGGGYVKALDERVLVPLALHDTYFAVPTAAQPRLAKGTNEDLAPVKPWSYAALAGTGGLISSVRDQLAFVEAELDASAGSKGTLRAPMRLSQESQLERQGDNESVGWQIDSAGRYGQTGGTAGFRAFVSFDPKTRRGIVILAATRTSAIDAAATQILRMLANEDVKPPAFPDAAAVAAFAGTYDFRGMSLSLVAAGKRLYLQDPSAAAKYRMVPITDHEFWVEALQSIVVFEKDGDKIKRAIFLIGNGENQVSAPRCPDTGCPQSLPTAPRSSTGTEPASGGR